MMKRTLIAAVLMASAGVASNYAVADVLVRIAPPPLRAEMVPPPRRGQIWAPGHWEWNRQRHIWINGSWLRDRPGYSYRGPTWVQRDGRWAMQGGRWARGSRDRDADGVPNRRDARPNNPNVR